MKKQIIISISIILLLVGNVIALCEVDINRAIETVTEKRSIQIFENKTIIKNVPNVDKFRADVTAYKNSGFKTAKPVLTYIQKSEIISVPKMQDKISYYIDWSSFSIKSKTITIPVYELKDVTVNRIKVGYWFNQNDGKFYSSYEEDCKI